MKNKSYHLTINHPHFPPHSLILTLAPPSVRGYCLKCGLEKDIRVISERPIGLSWEERKFCQGCALSKLQELEESNCEIENKAQVIKELKKALLEGQVFPESEELLECYG